jgi:hypothetical protein
LGREHLELQALLLRAMDVGDLSNSMTQWNAESVRQNCRVERLRSMKSKLRYEVMKLCCLHPNVRLLLLNRHWRSPWSGLLGDFEKRRLQALLLRAMDVGDLSNSMTQWNAESVRQNCRVERLRSMKSKLRYEAMKLCCLHPNVRLLLLNRRWRSPWSGLLGDFEKRRLQALNRQMIHRIQYLISLTNFA